MNEAMLADRAVGMAATAARDWMLMNKAKPASAAKLERCVKEHVKKHMPEALADFKAAYECRMVEVGVMSFAGTMRSSLTRFLIFMGGLFMCPNGVQRVQLLSNASHRTVATPNRPRGRGTVPPIGRRYEIW